MDAVVVGRDEHPFERSDVYPDIGVLPKLNEHRNGITRLPAWNGLNPKISIGTAACGMLFMNECRKLVRKPENQ